ncbi:MAG: thermopsin family protease [Ferroplasma sp.]|uniref:thermopsin family protease n=1 Tax=Ferroplasma sp. TaxID=2591003 RepID=UPI002814F8D8|nr:thermopsin family protease [Ferroplasma sp.]WMT50836.1 MAG: thermopsin family protease [Ferroplasma sp.]
MKKILAVIVAIIFVALAMAVVTSQGTTSTAASPAAAQTASAQGSNARLLAIEKSLEAKGIPMKDASFPAMVNHVTMENGVVEPSYLSAPAPMGIGFYGTQNVSGHLVGYNLTTPSVMASININNMSDFYLLNDGPTSETFQLNSVLTNVTLFGNSTYTFWTQNVAFYSERTQTIEFLTNIWNFSSPAVEISSNVFHSYGGILDAPTFYYAIGPTIHVTTPFTLNLYLNSTVVDRDSAVFFNYSIASDNHIQSGSYDYAIFNSTYGQPANYTAPAPTYLASGTHVTPTGFIPFDFEIMVGGPGGGSTTSIYDVNATMNLKYQDGNRYVNVPSAYDVGSETGETSEGVAVSWDNDTAYLTPGPSMVYGMWNISSSNAMAHYSGTVGPSNAFMFVSQGSTFNIATAAWAPLSLSGHYSFTLPAGSYSATALLSDYREAYFAPGSNVMLQHDYRMGIYTPLYAFDNAQIANISMHGNGTPGNPYIMDNRQVMPISPLFEEFNDYAFPVFAGVLLKNTNASVVMANMPSMYIGYTSTNPTYELYVSFYGFPNYNFLNYEMYNASNATLWKSNDVTGYFSASLTGFPVANVLIWNSTNDLIGGNYFNVMDSGLLAYKSPDVTIWGNYFVNSTMTDNSTFQAISNIWGAPLGVAEFSSGDTIYNNYFTVTITAYSPDYSIYSDNTAMYINHWNITKQPAFIAHYVNGFALRGSIAFTFYQGGNYWYNFNGAIPYNNDGLIAYGGDYVPLQPFFLFFWW